jgi:hypothetical protein
MNYVASVILSEAKDLLLHARKADSSAIGLGMTVSFETAS